VHLKACDDSDGEVPLAGQRAHGGRDGASSDTGDLAEQAPPVQTLRTQPRGDGAHHMPVRHGREERGVQPLRPDRQAFGVAARADVATRAGAREQRLVGTRRSGCARRRGRARRTRGTCRRPAPRPGATRCTRVRSARRRPSAGGAGDTTPTESAATLGASGFVDAARAGSAIGAPRHGCAEPTLDSGAARHRFVARRADTPRYHLAYLVSLMPLTIFGGAGRGSGTRGVCARDATSRTERQMRSSQPSTDAVPAETCC